MSLGLGRNECPIESQDNSKPLSLTQKFSRIVDSATDTELVHETLNDNLEDHVYYRFNPYMPEYLPLGNNWLYAIENQSFEFKIRIHIIGTHNKC